MKTVLILVIGCDLSPWDKMPQTSLNTWDSIEVPGTETIYYFGNPIKPNTDKFIYFPIEENYYTMGNKMLMAFEWALQNKQFDFIARVNSSCYVNKKELIKHVQTLPTENLFAGGVVVDGKGNQDFCWGGLQYVISKDVIQKIVDNKAHWNHALMEDISLSYLVKELGIPFTNGIGCSIDKFVESNKWRCVGYGTESYGFDNFSEIKKDNGQFFFRCKQDYDRDTDAYVMRELFKNLNND